jgi:outer membrane protein
VVPIFDGFYTKGRVQETSATISRARRDLDEARRDAQREVASVLEELLASRENLAAAELNLTAAERALEQTTLRYDVGKAGQLDVLNAQSERFAAHSNVIDARYEVLAKTASLKRAVGIHPTVPLARVREAVEGTSP